MLIFLDESGDLGWSFDKPRLRGGSSRFITIAGIIIQNQDIKHLARVVQYLCINHDLNTKIETKGTKISDAKAVSIVSEISTYASRMLQIISITADKRNVNSQLRRDNNVFYNHLLNTLLSELIKEHDDLQLILDDRTIRSGSRNSFEDCIRAKCWGELGLNTNISCRFEESHNNPGIWLADWLANFVWRHYERNMSDPYLQCINNYRFQERRLFM